MRNPGPGGWAYILRYGDHVAERAGGVHDSTTNNRMEIQAAIEGLKALKEPCRVLLVTDSTYLLNGINIYRHMARQRLGDSPEEQQTSAECRPMENP